VEWLESWEVLDWIKARTNPEPFGLIARLIPRGYEAYCRILHPIHEDVSVADHSVTWDQTQGAGEWGLLAEETRARVPEDLRGTATLIIGSYLVPPDAPRVRWADVAERYGQPLTPETNYAELMDAAGFHSWPRYLLGPSEGDLGFEQSARLSARLAEHTGDGEDVWFTWFATHTRDWMGGLLKGRLHELQEALLSDRVTSSPEYWWPDGRSWFVSTDVDATFTVVGGTPRLVEHIVADSEFESQIVTPDTPLSHS
jgi:hypothetical protein